MSQVTLQNHPVIKKQRSLLTRLLDIARAMERMNEGLQAVVFLGEPESRLPPEIRTFFSEIGDRLKQQSKSQLLKYIEKLDGLIEKDIKQVLSITELQAASDAPQEFPESSFELLNDFRRRAQTSISLRMLLRKRGHEAPEIGFDFSLPDIKKKLSDLEKNENSQRQKAVHQIRNMQKELVDMLESPDQTDEMKQVLQGVNQGLENDIKAVISGEKLENLSMSFEQVEEDESWHTPFYADDETVQEAAADEDEQSVSGSEETEPMAVAEKHGTGFWGRLKRWLLTPWGVSWKQIEKDSSKDKDS